MVDEAEKYAKEDEEIRERIQSRNELETYMYSITATLNEDKIKETLSEDEYEQLSTAVKNTQEWFDSHENEDSDTYKAKTKSLQETVMPLMSKIHGAATEGMPTGMPTDMPTGTSASFEEGVSVDEID